MRWLHWGFTAFALLCGVVLLGVGLLLSDVWTASAGGWAIGAGIVSLATCIWFEVAERQLERGYW